MPELFHFQQPAWFWLLIPLALLIWWLRQSGEASSAWRKVCDARLLPFLLDARSGSRSSLPLVLLGLGGLLTILALADPVWQQQPQPVYRNEAARVIVLDLSNSMLSPDLKPSRLVRARYKVTDILKQGLDGQTGLVVFAGDAFAVAPLTHDTDTIEALLSPLEPALMPSQGSRVDLGLQKAVELMQQAGIQRGDILLITDGFDGKRAIDAARQAARDGYRVSVLGVGTDAGAPIPTGRGGYLHDAQGDIVNPALDRAALERLAAAGGGDYRHISSSESDIKALLLRMTPQLSEGKGERNEQAGLQTDTWQSNGPWLALLLLPLAALAFRRGWLLVLVLLVGGTLSGPQPAMALGWDDLWLRPDQQAAQALQAGEAERAAQLARDPALRGTAEYRAGNYKAAEDAFAARSGADADADYNQGNALARMQRYEEAIAAYDQALQQQPGMEDALHNKAEIEKLLQQQKEQEQQQQQDGQQGKSGKDSDKQQGQQGESGEDSDKQQGQQGESGEDSDKQQGQQGESGEDSDQQQGQQGEGSEQQSAGNEAGDQDEQSGEAGSEQQQAQAGEESGSGAEQETAAGEDTGEQGEQGSEAQQQAAEDSEEQGDQPGTATAEPLDTEEQRAAEQWLRRIPDDPAGLLRRKFLYQYNQRAGRTGDSNQQAW